MGKSNLMTRTAQRLETKADVWAARIDLSYIGTQDDKIWYRDLRLTVDPNIDDGYELIIPIGS